MNLFYAIQNLKTKQYWTGLQKHKWSLDTKTEYRAPKLYISEAMALNAKKLSRLNGLVEWQVVGVEIINSGPCYFRELYEDSSNRPNIGTGPGSS